jgi:uncharacterized protein (TIRG00374 family)
MPDRIPGLNNAQPMTGSSAPSALAHIHLPRLGLLAAALVAVGVPVGLVLWAGWREVIAAAGAIGALAIAAALGTSLCNYLLRFARWQRFVKVLGHVVPLRRNLTIYLSGLTLTATPGKAGELVRGVFLKPHGIPYAQSFVLVFWDRLSDLAGVLILAVAAGGLLASGYSVLLPGVLLVIVLLWVLRPGGAVFSRALLFLEHRLSRRVRSHVRGLTRLRQTDANLTPTLALVGATAGASAYAAQGIGLLVLAHAAGVPLDLAGAILVASVSTLAGAAVLLPGGAGMVEVTSVALLAAQGVPQAEAVALGLVHRLTTFWFAISLGAGCLAFLLRGAKAQVQERRNVAPGRDRTYV